MRLVRSLLLVLLVAMVALPAAADEILDQISQAIELYKAGDFAGAAGDLEFAAAQIRQMRAGELSSALPAALPGWTADEAETAAAGMAMMGGGTTASRSYIQDDASVDVQIITDSPLLGALSGMINNPMILSASGQKLVRIKGNKAALEWEGDRGTLSVVVMGQVLVIIDGDGCTKDDLTKYAEAVDYGMIKDLMSR